MTDGAGITQLVTRTYSHAIRLNNLSSPIGPIPTLDSLDGREQTVIQAALDGSYTTDTLPEWLTAFLAETSYIQVDTEYYLLKHSLPATTITATETDRDAVSGEIASSDAYETAVTHDDYVRTGLLQDARDGGVEVVHVWPALQSFLDNYEAVEYRGTLLSLTVTTNDPGAPYTVSATSVSHTNLADGSVWKVSDASPSVQGLIRDAAATTGLYPFSDPPGQVISMLREYEYVYFDGEFYTAYVEQAGIPPIEVRATTEPHPDQSETVLTVTLVNTTDTAVDITSGAPTPVGVLRYQKQGTDSREVLWSPAYTESEHVHTDGRDVTAVNRIALTTTIDGADSASQTFRHTQESLTPGDYRIESSVGYQSGENSGTVPYSIEFMVRERDEPA
ncbi:hypothetical protein [Natrinema gari]|uniref:DUF8130 domain-containing protein n=1 Tax=Natrinema gari JCM 14663 TaxID=1230459 RepID=L9YUJ4_9EURY|nr:hypothetical protein [Natrinema gari]ELY77147.1 hypothetical protein C486_16900 [Natrinema gari JCM 14663]